MTLFSNTGRDKNTTHINTDASSTEKGIDISVDIVTIPLLNVDQVYVYQ